MNTTESLTTDFPPATTESQNELGEVITNLWVAHANAKVAARSTNQELRALRAKLGQQLCRMKEVLVKPGCDGQWSGFLRGHNIPRATGDRLVARHLRSLNPDTNRLTGAVSEPTEQEMMRCFNSILPRLNPFLKAPGGLFSFVALITAHYRGCSETTDRGILVLKPDPTRIGAASPDGDSVVESELPSCLNQ